MPFIYWTGYQERHITKRHGVEPNDFDEAWNRREDLYEFVHRKRGPYFESLGFTNKGRLLEMIWRWQNGDVWPITAYFVEGA